jgi:predicted nucleotidyltransferase
MPNSESQLIKRLMLNMNERAKELRCLYGIDDIIKSNASHEVVFTRILEVIPSGWQYTTVCEARILYLGIYYSTADFRETPWMMSSEIVVDNRVCGRIDVAYLQLIEGSLKSAFIPEEKQLLNAIASRIGNYIFYRRMQQVLENDGAAVKEMSNAEVRNEVGESDQDIHWRWRRKMMEELASRLNGKLLGVKAVYLAGSAREHQSGPGSDIDLIIHFAGDAKTKEILKAELNGWSKCLSIINFERTGYATDNIIDVHFVTDDDIKAKDSFALMILPPMRADMLKDFTNGE